MGIGEAGFMDKQPGLDGVDFSLCRGAIIASTRLQLIPN